MIGWVTPSTRSEAQIVDWLDVTTGLPVRPSIAATASTDRHAVHEQRSASASGRHAREANSTTDSGSWSLMPWLPEAAARGSPSTFSTSKPWASRYARSFWLFHSGYGVATEIRRAPNERSASTTEGLVATAGTPAAPWITPHISRSHPGPLKKLPVVHPYTMTSTFAVAR